MANDTIEGGSGEDDIDAGAGNNSVTGDNGNDIIVTGAGIDTIQAGSGDDTVDSGDGDDTVTGDNGNDTLLGKGGSDRLDAGSGNDRVEGGDGSDILIGQNGDDILLGGPDNDTLTGDSGNDTLDGGPGIDSLTGGLGTDTCNNGETLSSCEIVSVNRPPVANAGPDQTHPVNTSVQLNGTGSTDPDGNALSFQWTFVSRPAGSTAALTGATTPTPSFVLDKAGSYTAQLTVSDGQLSSTDTVVISTSNSAPVANAGPDRSGQVGTTLTLDGSGSSDVDGNALTYQWSVTAAPAGSTATLTGPTTVTPTFTIDKAGTYTIQLLVNDGQVNSAPDTLIISTINSAPVANAGPDQSGQVGRTLTLDGSGSSDVDGTPLTFVWSLLSKPATSAAIVTNPTAVTPTITLDAPGTYVVQLLVDDGTVNSTPDTVTLSTVNSKPLASAGAAQSGRVGETITLNGSGSSDVDGDPLTYRWALTSKPAGSTATLGNPTTATPSFVIDKAGTYTTQLIVNDGTVDSDPSTVSISTLNSKPVANAGPDKSGQVGTTITLDGSGSSDVDGDALTYRWALTVKPNESTATLTNATAVAPSFVIDKLGTYTAQLIVNDGHVDSDPSTVTISTLNTKPVANAGADQHGVVGTIITLDGTGSNDVDGNPLTYQWALISKPADSTATLQNPTSSHPTFTLDKAGTYTAQLIVNDGHVDSDPATVTVTTLNSQPVANAGPAQSVAAGTLVTLNGSGSSDVDGNPLTYQWNLITKPASSTAVLSNPTTVSPSFTPDIGGAYVVQLIVNDSTVDSDPDSMTIIVTVVDPTPPTITATVTPAPNANNWNNTDVTVSFTCADSGSGVAVCPPSQTVSAEGANQVITGTARDNAGNTATATVTVNLDLSNPVIALTTPVANAVVRTTTVEVTGSVNDAVSGVAAVTCNGIPATVSGGTFQCVVPLQVGLNTIVAQVQDRAGRTAQVQRAVVFQPGPAISITNPPNLSSFNRPVIAVTGTVSAEAVEVKCNEVVVGHNAGTFGGNVPLKEGNTILTCVAEDATGNIGSASISVSLDSMPLRVTLDSPVNNAVVVTPLVPVTGIVNDLVMGTVNGDEAGVICNGVHAQVANRRFLIPELPLSVGTNTITCIGEDKVGNVDSTTISVTFNPTAPKSITVVSGNNQTVGIGTALPELLTVELRESGAPAIGKPVLFKVLQNDGVVSANGQSGRQMTITTDSSGRAAVQFTVGSWAGAGNNQVTATANGFIGEARFVASALPAEPQNIVVDAGSLQFGIINQPLPKPFVVAVIDRGSNRLGGVPVTFRVVQGGGTLNGQSEVTVTTDTDGRAAIVVTLGPEEGFDNNLVEATFLNNPGATSAFTASGKVAGDPADTTISGVVLDNSNNPVQGVTLHVEGTGLTTLSDAQGQFVLQSVPVGRLLLPQRGRSEVTLLRMLRIDKDHWYLLGAQAKDALLVKADDKGNIIWSKTFDLEQKADIFLDGFATNDGGTVLVAQSKVEGKGEGSEPINLRLMKVDVDGKVQAEQTLPGQRAKIARTLEGGCAATYDLGQKNSQDTWLQIFDAELKPKWKTHLFSSDFGFTPLYIATTTDSGFVIATTKRGIHLWIVKVDKVGKQTGEYFEEHEPKQLIDSGFVADKDTFFLLAELSRMDGRGHVTNKAEIIEITTK